MPRIHVLCFVVQANNKMLEIVMHYLTVGHVLLSTVAE
jgi:hypothetical protein